MYYRIDKKASEVAELRKQANELHKQCEQESALLSAFREKLHKAEQAADSERTKYAFESIPSYFGYCDIFTKQFL